MIIHVLQFPVFEALKVSGYSLYPDKSGSPGIQVRTNRGPWIVLGANGLGKSTLLLLLKHLIVGPVQLRSAGFTGERSDLVGFDSKFFAVRVADGAKDATAEVMVRFGKSTLHISRTVNNLQLLAADLRERDATTKFVTEESYRSILAKLMGVAQFEDALRVLDRIVFFLEDRQPLIWDVSAQFELFRALLTPKHSIELRRLEGEIVSNDSSARNLNSALFKLMNRRNTEIAKNKNVTETQARLASATAELDALESGASKLRDEIARHDETRSDLRIELKRSEVATDDAARVYEETKFKLLRHAFANVPLNHQYVLLKLISDQQCLVCGNQAPAAASELAKRVRHSRCIVCGTVHPSSPKITATATAMQERAEQNFALLQKERGRREAVQSKFYNADREHLKKVKDLEHAQQRIDALQRDIRRLRSKLPKNDKSAAAQEEDRIQGLRREVENFRRDRSEAENSISVLLESLKKETEKVRSSIEMQFQKRVKSFFGEHVRLVYAARKARIGQGGREFEFPAFEVEMVGAASEGGFIRRSADQVSLSQREFLDIVFRMSILEALSEGGCSIIIDGPEGSLDAVFAERAGLLLSNFSDRRPASNCWIACNIIDGAFIPGVLAKYSSVGEKRERIINLLNIALPTPAVSALKSEYAHKLTSLLRQKV